jgi:hypothetical protein
MHYTTIYVYYLLYCSYKFRRYYGANTKTHINKIGHNKRAYVLV